MVSMRIKEKNTGNESNEISIEELIYNQNEIEFVFDEYDTDSFIGEFPAQLPYSDFLAFKDDYEVIVKVGGKNE